jgi:hypothetical protein
MGGEQYMMKTRTIALILIVMLVLVFIGIADARYGSDCARYVDADVDGVCDNIGINVRDADGDGIPNGQDNDYQPLCDKSSYQHRNGKGNH